MTASMESPRPSRIIMESKHNANISQATPYSSYAVRVHTRYGIQILSFDLLATLFSLTAKKAAEKLGISSRTLIRVCRSLGIRRWPYLGFRIEKNVDRIRQEAYDNLQQILQKEAANGKIISYSTEEGSSYTNTSCLRGASAKRLLKITHPLSTHSIIPNNVSPSMRVQVPRLNTNANDLNTWCPNPDEENRLRHMSRTVSYDTNMPMYNRQLTGYIPYRMPQMMRASHAIEPNHHPLALLTPPQNGGFKMDHTMTPGNHISPRKAHAMNVSNNEKNGNEAGQNGSIPPLNLLVDASILTSFKHEMPSPTTASPMDVTPMDVTNHQVYYNQRTMSMRDILTRKV